MMRFTLWLTDNCSRWTQLVCCMWHITFLACYLCGHVSQTFFSGKPFLKHTFYCKLSMTCSVTRSYFYSSATEFPWNLLYFYFMKIIYVTLRSNDLKLLLYSVLLSRVLWLFCYDICHELFLSQFLTRCDEVYVMSHGKIVGSGTHEHLIQHCPKYSSLIKVCTQENARNYFVWVLLPADSRLLKFLQSAKIYYV